MAKVKMVSPNGNPENVSSENAAAYLAKGYRPFEEWEAEQTALAAPELLEAAKAARIHEIAQGYHAALAASLTMPAENPSAADVAVGAALFAAEDAEGLEYVSQAHASKYAALVKAVEEAQSVEAVEAVKVAYAV